MNINKISTSAHVKYGIVLFAAVALIGVVLWMGYINQDTRQELQNPPLLNVQQSEEFNKNTITYTTQTGEKYDLQSDADTLKVRRSVVTTKESGKPLFVTEAPDSPITVAVETSANSILAVAFMLETDFSQILLDAEGSILAGDFEMAQDFIDKGISQIDDMEQELIIAEKNIQDLNDMIDGNSLSSVLRLSLQTYAQTTDTFIGSLRSLFEIRRATLTLDASSQAEADAVQVLTDSVSQQAQFFAGSLRSVERALARE